MMEGMFKGLFVALIMLSIPVIIIILLAEAFGQNMSQMGHTPKATVSKAVAARAKQFQDAPWVVKQQELK